MLSVDRSESRVKRRSQQIRELQETVSVSQGAVEFEDPGSAISEVSGRTLNGVVNHNHVSEANSASSDVANSVSRDGFDKSTPAHVERMNFFHKCWFPREKQC